MGSGDGQHWDDRWRRTSTEEPLTPAPPTAFVDQLANFPQHGTALEIACGRGGASVWLAQRGLRVHAVDASPVAIDQARRLAEEHGVEARLEVHDLDRGLPEGESCDLVLCHMFRDPKLYAALVDRLAPGGLLAIAVLSEVGAVPGRFRAKSGELIAAFEPRLDVVAHGEADGRARLLARAQ